MNTNRDKPQPAFAAAKSPEAVGVLVVGHGTRDPAGVAEFLATAAKIEARAAPLPVAACFLELAEPTIEAGVARLMAAGVREILVAPLILFAAGHAKRDIPEAVAAAVGQGRGSAGDLTIRQLPHLGCRPELLALSERRYREALREADEVADEETLLLMVGRGSRDAEATAEMYRFAELRFNQQQRAATPTGGLEVAFTAMAEPSLEDAIETVARLPFRRIVVQPHLLFAGQLLDRVRATTADAARRFPDQRWIVTGHLGPEPEIVDAVCTAIFSRADAGNDGSRRSGE